MSAPSVQELLEAGVHFGHQTARWNPKMRPYILTARNDIHIINLERTQKAMEEAIQIVEKTLSAKKRILFVGTKITAKKIVKEAAEDCGQFYATERWLGGMLTNFQTVRKSIKKLENIEKMEKDGIFKEMQKKEVLRLNKQRQKLDDVFSGIRHMKAMPGLMFITDIKHEHIALAEAHRLHIPVMAICDTNVDPETVDHPIPGNDDAVKSLKTIVDFIAAACKKGAPTVDKEKAAAAEVAAEKVQA